MALCYSCSGGLDSLWYRHVHAYPPASGINVADCGRASFFKDRACQIRLLEMP